jgi:hypothetical protein
MNSATTSKETEMTELATRINDGVAVSLLWSRRRNTLTVTVDDSRTGESFELEAPNNRAMDVFNHPYAYASSRSADVADLLAARGPIFF